MSFTILKEEEFTSFIEKCKEHSFMQTVSMSNLLKKRGFETKYLGWKSNNEITVAAIAFMKHLIWRDTNIKKCRSVLTPKS